MNRQTTFLLFGLTLLFNQVSGQTFKQQFNDLVSKKDTSGQQQLLEKWEKTDGNDPELFVAYFNYFVVKSKNEIITLGQNPKGKDVLQIMDQDTTKKEPVAFMYGDIHYNPDLLSKGFNWINKGIEKHPNRLDMRFGKIYMFGQIEDYETFTKEIIKTIDYSAINQNEWTWADSKPLDDPKEFMLSSIQNYQLQLYNTENDDLLDNMKRIAETVLKYYPDHIESLSNLSIVFMLQKQYDKALEPLLKAEKLNPKDYIVLSNIAQAYKLKGDTKNAIKYYELTLKHGDEQAKKYAQGQIDELKKK
ncbi:MAG: tetratricopeptide repeat protein [Flavobacteriales bacterium]|nr:tetratricopeptide repeat protein [Flavobacteriales bacterium]